MVKRYRHDMRRPPTAAATGLLVALALAATALTPASVQASPVQDEPSARGAVRSFQFLRDQNLVRQALDYSCGAAALATLLTFAMGDPTTEADILKDLLAMLSREQVADRERDGFSLLDMQRIAQSRGYRAQGFRVTAADLPKLTGPVIVFIKPQGYEHFAVLRGIQDDRVYLADPARGNVRMPAYRFLQTWLGDDGTGVVFVVEPIAPPAQPPMNRLAIPHRDVVQPEMLAARELLAVRAASTRSINPFR